MNRPSYMRLTMLLLIVATLAWGVAQDAPESRTIETPEGSYQLRSPEGLKARLGQVGNPLLINTHIPYEGEISSTDVFIPFNEIERYADILPVNKDAEIIVYCRSGGMSESAAITLVAMGYRNVTDVAGGMSAWQRAGYDLQRTTP